MATTLMRREEICPLSRISAKVACPSCRLSAGPHHACLGRHHGHVDGWLAHYRSYSIDGLYLNAGWCYGGFKATPAAGWCFSHQSQKMATHDCKALPRSFHGYVIDERAWRLTCIEFWPCIPCPCCGDRDLREFTYLGDASLQRRIGDTGCRRAIFCSTCISAITRPDFTELWYHGAGCHSWLVVCRNALTHEIQSAFRLRTTDHFGTAGRFVMHGLVVPGAGPDQQFRLRMVD